MDTDITSDTLRKFQKAAEIYDSLTQEQREIIHPHVEKILEIQRKINNAAKAVNGGQICSECSGGCCTNGIEINVNVAEYLYVMFVISLEQRQKIFEVIKSVKKDDILCSLVDEDGCALPNIARPIHCKIFCCFNVPGIKELKHYLHEADADYTYILDIMDIDY